MMTRRSDLLILAFTVLFSLIPVAPAFGQTSPSVDEIQLVGNRQIKSDALKSVMKTKADAWYRPLIFWSDPSRYDEAVFMNDLLRLEKYYIQEGFRQARVAGHSISGDKALTLRIDLEEGPPTMVESVDIIAEKDTLPFDLPFLKAPLNLAPGKRYRVEDLRLDYDALMDLFNQNGYPYATVRVKPDINQDNHAVSLQWRIDPGPAGTFGAVKIIGNDEVSERVIRRGIDIRPGEPFDQRKLEQARGSIYSLDLFRSVSIGTPGIENQPSAIPVEIRLQERELRALTLGGGYGSEEAVRLKADWTYHNFLGGARMLRAEVKHATNILPFNAELTFSQPYFLDDQNNLTIKPFYTWQDERSFEARRYGAEVSLTRRMTEQTTVFSTARVERDTVDVKGVPPTGLNNRYNKSILQIGVNRQSTDRLFSPTRGSLVRLVFEESGLFFRSRFKYYKIRAEYRRYKSMIPGIVLASRIEVGLMNPYRSSTSTPVEERFFSGGSNSIRGWGRQQLGPQTVNNNGVVSPTGGNSRLESSLELRYPLVSALGGVVFLDAGNVWSDAADINPADLHYAAGLGLRYQTPIGPFRIDYAQKLNKQRSDESGWQIHISIGQAF